VNYDNLAIACRGVVKRFHLYEQCTRSLRELVIHTLRGKPLNVSRPYFSLHDRGGTLIIASHDLATVRTLCRKALWMDHGQPRMLGEAGEVIEAYLGSVQRLTLVCSDDLAGMETM
jgi:hypothetical protein